MKNFICYIFVFLSFSLPSHTTLALESRQYSVDENVVQQFPEQNSAQGREEETTVFFNANDAVRKANSSYPDWFRGEGINGLADDKSLYWYVSLISPNQNAEGNLEAENLNLGILELTPGATYPAHSHPANELYFVMDGVADWYVNDEKQRVTAGSVIRHRPYDVHGWVNTSDSAPLTVVWLWWLEGDDTPEILDQGARFTNPDLSAVKDRAKPYAIPIPKTYAADLKVAQDYPGEYPVFGRLEGATAFFHENEAAKRPIDIHPEWSHGGGRGISKNGISLHWSRNLVTPSKYSEGNHEAENLYLGTFELGAGATYPAHDHPGSEFYLVLSGEADWYVNNQKKHVAAGTVIGHRAGSVHGFTNSHEFEPLKVLRVRWLEGNDESEIVN